MLKNRLNSLLAVPGLGAWALSLWLTGCAHSPPSVDNAAASASNPAPGASNPPPSAGNPAPSSPVVPSQRFDSLDLSHATIGKDDQGNVVAKLRVGVDMVGTLRTGPQSQLTYEQHPVMVRLSPTPQPLSPEDRASLAANLQRSLNGPSQGADPLWQQLLGAAQK